MEVNLGRSPTRGQAAPSWSQVGPKLGPCWPKLAPSGADVAAMSDRNGAFGRRCADMQNVQMCKLPRPEPTFGGSPGRT